MAVAVEENLHAGEAAGCEVGGFGRKKVGQQPDLPAHALGARVVREKLKQFVLEDAGATGFEEDDRKAGIYLLGQAVEDAGEIGARRAEQAEVVKRAAAAEVALRGLDLEAGLGK